MSSKKLKMPTIETFMTKKDEDDFSKALVSAISTIKFFDHYVWNISYPPIKQSIALCYDRLNSSATIFNEEIISLDEYIKNEVHPHLSGTGYVGNSMGKSTIQYQHSKEADYAKGCLMNGGLATSYFPQENPDTDAFVKTVWKIFKKGAKKVYAINRETGELYRDKPETRYFAWPDAAKIYDGTDGRYLTATTFNFYIAK
ncbi:hypothetical protein GHV27_17910 [Proteus mirabilis]|nr:hypothetical protein [Proteus mirabilis]